MAKYIYENRKWTKFHWQESALNSLFGEVRNLQGRLSAQMNALGFEARSEAALATLTLDVTKSSEIEGEKLDYAKVRSSIANKLGIKTAGLVLPDRHIDGVVEMMLDATQNFKQPLTHKRLFAWHSALFLTGYSGLHKIEVGRYRTGEMQIVSGAVGKEKVHYVAVPPSRVKKEMDQFILWFNASSNLDFVLKAAVAHFWFIIIHPFDDGNGRMARALTDLLLARSDGNPDRYYSMSSQILAERKEYYSVLQKVQHSSGDITIWLDWFLKCLRSSLNSTDHTLQKIFIKTEFWKKHEYTELNQRQRLVLNKLFDGFEGKLKSSKWAKMAKCSTDTALRDILDLMEKGILKKENGGGRNTNYVLVEFSE